VEKEKGKQRKQNRYTNKEQISTEGGDCAHSNQPNHQCNEDISLYINRVYTS